MKKALNDPNHVVREMLEGFSDLNEHLVLVDTENIILRADLSDTEFNVALISGGGSGHEPAQVGYVGSGFLHAAVAGDVFTSPGVETILTAIRMTSGAKGVVLLVGNYMGDRLNFGLAAELARSEGIPVEIVFIADDVSLDDTISPHMRRGIAGFVLVNKIAGAIASSGAELLTVKKATQDAADDIASMGVAFGSCTIPAVGHATFELSDERIELGLGVHGEKGLQRVPMMSADKLVDVLLSKILKALKIKANEQVALLINGLGGTTQMELGIISRSALQQLRDNHIIVERAWAGNFVTSLEMPGFSLSIMRLTPERLKYLDYPVCVSAWTNNGKIPLQRKTQCVPPQKKHSKISTQGRKAQPFLKKIAIAIANALEDAVPLLTELDSAAGDGDLGLSLGRGAVAIKALPESAWGSEVSMMRNMGEALRRAVSGTSGPLYAAGLLSAANYLEQQPHVTHQNLGEAFLIAANAVSQLGGAKLNDRTMFDALYPAAKAFNQSVVKGLSLSDALLKSIDAAEMGALKTTEMLPRLGRASYLGERALGVQDAGAAAVVCWLRAVKM